MFGVTGEQQPLIFPVPDLVVEGQKTEFIERRKSIDGQTAILNKRVTQFEKEIEGLEAQQHSKQEQLRIIKEELVGLRELHAKGYFPRTRILSMEREMARLRGARGADLASIAGSQNGIGEAQLQIIQLEQRFREEVVNDLRESRDENKQLQERLVVAPESTKYPGGTGEPAGWKLILTIKVLTLNVTCELAAITFPAESFTLFTVNV